MTNTQKSVRGTIKMLKWLTPPCDRGQIAVTNVGKYGVFDEGDPRWVKYSSGGGYEYHHVDSFEEAKSAAQADYESRIIAEIQPDPEQEPVAWGESYDCGNTIVSVRIDKSRFCTFPLFTNPLASE